MTERPSSPERGIDGQWVETTGQEIANRQIDDEHVGRSSQSFEPVFKGRKLIKIRHQTKRLNKSNLEKT